MVRKKGFTLVELSIVLVIIGLLIGGILAAQSMIGTAKIQALVRQVGQFDAAVENFQTKYGQLPGDNNLMGINTTYCNNDGVLLDPYGVDVYFQGELGKFWSDLSISGLTNSNGGAYLDGSGGVTPTTAYVPKALSGLNASILAAGDSISKSNFYIFAKLNQASLVMENAATTGAYYAVELAAIDTKIDDGLATSGNVQDLNTAFTRDLNNHSPCSSSSQYTLSDTTDLCVLKIRIGSSTGDLR